jgi:toxin ParE1/3/4
MGRVTRRPLAAVDILDVWDHIAEDSLEQADRWIDNLDEHLKLIATQPLMGRARGELAAPHPDDGFDPDWPAVDPTGSTGDGA